ncbi:hypothetical protein R1sor_005021 [Riccia sorocarpa]|uniref:Uncharacterized protein n=1 Tax=Riccia sorocarpa TaxID=122646 RepID=A0ABD3HMN6_9MARC
MYYVKFFPDEAKHALRKMPDIDSIDNDECLRLSLLFGFLEEDQTWVQNDVRDQPSETILGPAAMSALLNNVRPKTEKEQADEGGGLQSEAKTLETSITEPARRAKLAELLQQFLDQSAEQIKQLKEAIKQPRPKIDPSTFSSEAERKAKELCDYQRAYMYKRAVPVPKKRKTSNKKNRTTQNVLPLTTTFEIKNKTQEEEELDEVWADFEFVKKQTEAAVKAKLSVPSPLVAPVAAEDPEPWIRMSKQEMLAHYRGLKRIRYERRFYEFLKPGSSTDRDKEWKKLRQLKMDPKLYHSLVATVQHMVERHGAKEPEYSEFWWPPIVYDPEPPLKPGTQVDIEEWERFKREHPKEAEDWEKVVAEREKKNKKEDEAAWKRIEERRNERKAQAERIEERENKRKKTQAEAIETIKRRYKNGSLLRDVGLEPRCQHEVQWNHCPQCRIYGRTPFLEWCDDHLCERADLIERNKQAKEAK